MSTESPQASDPPEWLSWKPKESPHRGKNFRSRALVAVDPDTLALRPTWSEKIFGGVFAVFGLMGIAMCVLLLAQEDTDPIGVVLGGVVGLGFLGFGSFTLWKTRSRFLFHRTRGVSREPRDTDHPLDLSIEELAGLQLLSRAVQSERAWVSHEMILVTKSKRRILLSDQPVLFRSRREAERLAEHLALPLWDRGDDKRSRG